MIKVTCERTDGVRYTRLINVGRILQVVEDKDGGGAWIELNVVEGTLFKKEVISVYVLDSIEAIETQIFNPFLGEG